MNGSGSRVIKKGASRSAAPVPTPEELLAGARERAQQILATAEADAARLRAAAGDDARAERLAAVAEGRAEGMGLAAAALARVAEVRDARLAEVDAAVVDVALEIARRLVGQELAARPEAVLDVARRALRASVGAGDVLLRVAPGDVAAVRDASPSLGDALERGSLAVVEDPALERGEVIVEAVGGRVDARIPAQLEAFRRALHAEGR